ncbi:unnamed protein product [Amoebophrya sp. A120]|nr:unnamed protein product [Amoebophrya sp. A120]|eukprot:GSA120T00017492001.1
MRVSNIARCSSGRKRAIRIQPENATAIFASSTTTALKSKRSPSTCYPTLCSNLRGLPTSTLLSRSPLFRDPPLRPRSFECTTGRGFATKFSLESVLSDGSDSARRSPGELYRQLCDQKIIEADPMQTHALQALDRIFHQTTARSSALSSSSAGRTLVGGQESGKLSSAAGAERDMSTGPAGEFVRGLYLHGPAGSGKSMCMDLLFHSLSAQPHVKARRQHLHEFLYTLHRRLFQLKSKPNYQGASRKESVVLAHSGVGHIGKEAAAMSSAREQQLSANSAMKRFAEELKEECDVLCFDEFTITTIQDCTILAPLLAKMFAQNIVVVATSNRAPENLYEDGLNRYLYIPPLLEALQSHMDVMTVESQDYRLQKYEQEKADSRRYVDDTPDEDEEDEAAGRLLRQEASQPTVGEAKDAPAQLRRRHKVFFHAEEKAAAENFLKKKNLHNGSLQNTFDLEVGYGRVLQCEQVSADRKTARFSFGDLFQGPPYLGADDYNKICAQFHTIVLEELPVLQVEDHNEAKRLCNFLDCAYEHHVQLLCVDMECPEVLELFQNLVPLENINMEEVLREQQQSQMGSAVAEGAGNKTTARHLLPQVQGSGDLDQSAASSGVLSAVRAVSDIVGKQQQSCYFLSADHKNWSVESKIVGTDASDPGFRKSKSTSKKGSSSFKRTLSLKETPEVIAGNKSKNSPAGGADGRDRHADANQHLRFNTELRKRATGQTMPAVSTTSGAPGVQDLDAATQAPDWTAKNQPAEDVTQPPHHPDVQIWKQDAAGMPQVTKLWDEKRRVSQSEWEAADPTAEQHTVKGVFVAAIASLHETGFAVKRAISRLQEMQTRSYYQEWQRRQGLNQQ